MFHVEMRQFPHNFCRFNLVDRDLGPIVDPWVREKFVEFGERRWSPHEARLTILEGPELSLQELSMGRGWQAAQRQGGDVTERVLAVARQAAASEAARQAAQPPSGASAADPLALAVQIGSLLGPDASRLLEAWRATSAASAGLTPSQALALAEHQLASPSADAG